MYSSHLNFSHNKFVGDWESNHFDLQLGQSDSQIRHQIHGQDRELRLFVFPSLLKKFKLDFKCTNQQRRFSLLKFEGRSHFFHALRKIWVRGPRLKTGSSSLFHSLSHSHLSVHSLFLLCVRSPLCVCVIDDFQFIRRVMRQTLEALRQFFSSLPTHARD
jgi:hypothetical protein